MSVISLHWPRRRPSPDALERTMRELQREGSGMAGIAHGAAFAMVVLFSLGSLVALSGDALRAILAAVAAGGVPSVPSAISVAVSTLLVVCCDIGLIYAAMTLRVLLARGADDGQLLHWVVLVGVSVIEAGTYLYMSWLYERPTGWAWGLVIARAVAAPLLSVYLSMARPHPITPRDMLHQAELAQGVQLVRDVIAVASDPSAPLADKMALYAASAVMTPADRARLDGMMAVVSRRQLLSIAPAVDAELPLAVDVPDAPDPAPAADGSDYPTGGGSPAAQPRSRRRAAVASVRTQGAAVLSLPAPERRQRVTRARATPPASGVRTPSQARSERLAAQRAQRLAWVSSWMAADPAIGIRELTRKLRDAEHSRVSESTVNGLRREVEAARSAPLAAVAQ